MSLYDLKLEWGGDLQVSAQGDLLVTSDLPLLKERIIRRILTNKKALIFEPEYGAGLPQYVHATSSETVWTEIKQRIIREIYMEEAVSRFPEPVVNFTLFRDALQADIIVYTVDSQQVALQFEVNRNG